MNYFFSFPLFNPFSYILFFSVSLIFSHAIFADTDGSSHKGGLCLQGKWDMGRHSTTVFQYKVSSGQGELYKPAHLFDSNRLTIWMSERRNQSEWILVDFGEKRLMNRMELEFPSWALPNLNHYEVQVNIWGEWKTILKNNKPRKLNQHFFKGFDASQIRIYITTSQDNPAAVTDFRIFLGESLLTGIPSRFNGFAFPVQGGVIPESNYALPGAPRSYRNGYHKGIDIYEYKESPEDESIKMDFSTPILSIQKGIVVRIDENYIPMVEEDFERQKELTKKFPVTYVDRDFGGRQVWIDHGDGILSAYNHLSEISPKLKLGKKVKRGEIIGKAGNSGLKGEALQNEENIHLHLEIWIDGEYLGKGLSAGQSRQFLDMFFSR